VLPVIRILDAIDEEMADEEKATHQRFRDRAMTTLWEIASDSEAIGLHVLRNKRGVPIGVEEEPIGPTAVIGAQLGLSGRIAYSQLSAVAHGTLSGMTSYLEEVSRLPGVEAVSLASPSAKIPSLVNLIAVTLDAYQQATDRRMQLYGWDLTGCPARRSRGHCPARRESDRRPPRYRRPSIRP
jgi:hypothetical protein